MKKPLKVEEKTISNFIKHEKSLQMLLMSICTNIAHAAPSDRCAESACEWKGNVVVPCPSEDISKPLYLITFVGNNEVRALTFHKKFIRWAFYKNDCDEDIATLCKLLSLKTFIALFYIILTVR